MQIPMPCIYCSVDSSEGKEIINLSAALYPELMQVNDQGLYTFTCSKGHTTTTLLQQHKYETLFELASFAILDGYYREAVTSFSSCLERFYEFAIDFCLYKQGCSEHTINEAWSEVKRQSERQLGAFVILFTSLYRAPPKLLKKDTISFRNAVVHKGEIPIREKAIQFGDEVLSVIRFSIDTLKENYPDFKKESSARRVHRLHSQALASKIDSTTSPYTSIFLSPYDSLSLSQYLSTQSHSHTRMLFKRYLDSPSADLKRDSQTATVLEYLRSQK